MPPIPGQSPDGDKILVDRKMFRTVFSLLLSSLDELNYARHREVFLDSLNTFLTEPSFLDGDQCFQASLLLDAYYEYVPASLSSVRSNLEQALELMRVER
ncbi:hypothetical protein [Microcoleus sp. D3_18_C4]|uniref:hypothetical protein n=1 Tax=Microcoleus sp. D3_18_C4 TaxID=3055335 RepID=UPI002FD769A9